MDQDLTNSDASGFIPHQEERGKKKNSVLRKEARLAMQGNWGTMAIAMIVYIVFAIYCVFILECFTDKSTAIEVLIEIFLGYPLGYAVAAMGLDLYRRKEVHAGDLFQGYKSLGRVITTYILVTIYTFLWTLLLVIPGIIKTYSYSMVPFILKDRPELENNAAIEESMRIMRGHKMKLFLLDLSFIGWIILSCLTLGIGFIFLAPYMTTARAAFYEDVKEK